MKIADDWQPPLRYPASGQMSSIGRYHDRQGCVPEYVGLRRLTCQSSSRRPIEHDSDKTIGFSARKSCFRKRLRIPDGNGSFLPFQGIGENPRHLRACLHPNTVPTLTGTKAGAIHREFMADRFSAPEDLRS
jgi:hypothetical protein